MTNTPTPTDREALAKIIDPDAFSTFDAIVKAEMKQGRPRHIAEGEAHSFIGERIMAAKEKAKLLADKNELFQRLLLAAKTLRSSRTIDTIETSLIAFIDNTISDADKVALLPQAAREQALEEAAKEAEYYSELLVEGEAMEPFKSAGRSIALRIRALKSTPSPVERPKADFTLAFQKDETGLWFITSEDAPTVFVSVVHRDLGRILDDLPNILRNVFKHRGEELSAPTTPKHGS